MGTGITSIASIFIYSYNVMKIGNNSVCIRCNRRIYSPYHRQSPTEYEIQMAFNKLNKHWIYMDEVKKYSRYYSKP